ncbi:phage gp6-like head-tail connector protein [Xinfangfangia sp. D13-10-4-6]|nr:phage gp6-like head-tail connector protein [Pseudogemmobacter hezensis]
MSLPTALIRAHLNLDDDRDPELLTHYANVAAMWVAAYTGQPFTADNALMVQAALLVAHQYEAREAVTFASPHQLPFGVHASLDHIQHRIAQAVFVHPMNSISRPKHVHKPRYTVGITWIRLRPGRLTDCLHPRPDLIGKGCGGGEGRILLTVGIDQRAIAHASPGNGRQRRCQARACGGAIVLQPVIVSCARVLLQNCRTIPGAVEVLKRLGRGDRRPADAAVNQRRICDDQATDRLEKAAQAPPTWKPSRP